MAGTHEGRFPPVPPTFPGPPATSFREVYAFFTDTAPGRPLSPPHGRAPRPLRIGRCTVPSAAGIRRPVPCTDGVTCGAVHRPGRAPHVRCRPPLQLGGGTDRVHHEGPGTRPLVTRFPLRTVPERLPASRPRAVRLDRF